MCISLLLGIYGTYPAVFTDPDHAESTLRNYCDGVLYKDLFALAGIRQNEKFMHLVKLLAYNVGSEVNYDNLARDTGLSRTTVADYLQLLEQCFIIKICPSFSRNLSNELKEALQKTPLPSRMEQKCSVRLFLTTPECAVFLPIQ